MTIPGGAARSSSVPFAVSPLLPLLLLLLLLGSAVDRASSSPDADYVPSLPGYGPPPTRQWSGYLDATEGCDTSINGEYCKIHYWFAEAEGGNDADARDADLASEKPVVLWLNGGPGSSSVLGFLQELGPLLMNATGGFMKNPWSWTNEAHVLVIESPVGVGYSYCAAQVDGGKCHNTDKYTASSARAALVDFFTTKFPELSDNEFFITGESYAGVYIPTLSKEILDHASSSDVVNLRGIAVGDPCTDNDAQADSMDSLWYGHKYGLVPDQAFDLLWHECKMRSPSVMARGGPHAFKAEVTERVEAELGEEWSDLDRDDEETRDEIRTIHRETLFHPGPHFVDSTECKLARRKFLLQTSKGLSQGWDDMYIDDYSLFGPGGYGKEDDDMARWMMRPDVRRALHVEDCPSKQWPIPENGFKYKKEYDACNWNEVPAGAPSMIDFYREIAPKLDVSFVYNGDTDPCVSYEGTRTAISRVDFPELDGGGYRPWFYNHTAAPPSVLAEKSPMFGPDLLTSSTGAQFGGEVVNYEHGLSFLTVHGSGHMVPQFRPQAALHMLGKLLRKEGLLSPLLPKNETLAEMGAKEFSKVMDEWTEKAKGPPYVVGAAEEEEAEAAKPVRGGATEVGGKQSVY